MANDIANDVLDYYVRKGALAQTTQDKPLLRVLRESQETFPGGKGNVSEPVQGAFMSDTNLPQGYTQDDQLNFNQASNVLRAVLPWKEMHYGLEIAWTELKQDGITITDNNAMSEHKNVNVVRIIDSILKNRIADWMESWARGMNSTFWANGAQDPKAVPGMTSILQDVANANIASLSQVTYKWWQQRVLLGIAASAENQTLTKTLRSELRQLTRYGGKPNTALCGSKFIDALELEVQDKGLYTQEGFKSEGKTDAGIAKISMGTSYGVDRGARLKFEYDPSLDDMGYATRCYVWDTSKLKLRPMEGEDNKLLTPERPYNYLVFFKSMTWTGTLIPTQMNCHGIYSVNP